MEILFKRMGQALTTWMHGPERVKFKDRGDTAIFHWISFRLEVEEY